MKRLVVSLAVFASLLGCEHPIPLVTTHVEAADLVITDAVGAELARTVLNQSWSKGELRLRDGVPLRVGIVPLDFRGAPISMADRTDLSVRLELEDAALLQWEPQRGYGWLRPFKPGRSRMRFLLWHVNHADFVSPWLPVTVERE